MRSEWPVMPIAEIADKVAMGPFGSNIKVSTFVPSGVPIISGGHLHGTTLEEGDFNFITEEHADKLKNSIVTRGDVVFTHAGNIGQVAAIPDNSRYDRYVISQRQFYARCDRNKILPAYLAYYFHGPEGRHELLANASQVGVPSIARPSSHLKSIEIPVPPIEYQRTVCHILGALEERIANNRALAAKLESIARAIFKSWFVDFDPVRAKMEGREPEGMNSEIAALFPDRLVESELGLVPEGWSVEPLGDVLTLQRGFDLPEKYRTLGNYPVVAASGRSTFHNEFKVEGPGVITGRSGVVGRVYIEKNNFWPLNTTLWVKEYKKSDPFSAYFMMERVNYDAHRGGSAVPTLNRNHVHGERVIVANEEIRAMFSSVAKSCFEKIWHVEEESKRVYGVKCRLLPRLIAGRMRLLDNTVAE